MAQTAKKWILAKQFAGVPKQEDFKLEEEPISFSLKPGEIVIEALFLSVDPYVRIFPIQVGDTVLGEQVARVKVSNNPGYPEGTLVLAHAGWRTLTLVPKPDEIHPAFEEAIVRKLPDLGDLSPSLCLGCLGLPGLTAYFGLLDRGQPKPGEVVLVSGAAGAVGSMVGQIAKIKGCTVIGSAGSKEKCDWLKELGFDHVFNYKETTVDEALKQFAPGGIDLFFDNVGGESCYNVLLSHMKMKTRVVSCGTISQYNNESIGYNILLPVIMKHLDVRGMYLRVYTERLHEGVQQMLQWIKQGKLKYRETVTEGFDRVPEAFISLFQGSTMGKTIVKA